MRRVMAGVVGWMLVGAMSGGQPYIPPPGKDAAPGASPAPEALPEPSAPVAEAQPGAPESDVRLEDIPAPVKLGVRTEIVRLKLPAMSTLVIVPSADAYLDALSRWTLEARFPVLIDDGTDGARENIVRFARAFEAQQVLLYEGEGGAHAASIEALQARVEAVAARAWSAENAEGLSAQWKRLEFTPPGVVVASGADTAWTGGAALAAFRGQPIVWVGAMGDPLGSGMSKELFDALAKEIEAGLERTGYAWRGVGDDIEAITLCLSGPDKVMIGATMLALTDVLGRADVTETGSSSRWAYASMAPGSAAEAAYRAMSSLFLQPTRAFLFNGYAGFGEGGFEAYAIGPASELLRKAGLEVVEEEAPRDPLGDWRRRVLPPLDAGLVHVNSAGFARMFRLGQVEVSAAEIPSLKRPALVHFIHSFSAQNIGDELSIARRWLDGGAFAYVGSVDEPYLTAFHTPERFVARMLARAPISAAARVEAARPWKINVYGDALFTWGPPAPRFEGAPELTGAVDAAARMRESLSGRDFATAFRMLSVLQRDADVVRVFGALLRDDAGALTPDAARAAFWSAVRARADDMAMEAARRMSQEHFGSALAADALWQVGRERLMSGDGAALEAMRGRIRAHHGVEDATLVARGIRAAEGAEAARAYLQRVMDATADAALRAQLQERLRYF